MPIDVNYRPAITTLTGFGIALDGWAAGARGVGVETSNGVVDAQGTVWELTKLDGWHDAPPVRTSMTTRPGEHGAFDGPAYLHPRVLTIEGYAVATSRVNAWRARDIVASVCGDPSLGLQTLVVTQTGHINRRLTVRRSAETKTAFLDNNMLKFSMLLIAPDPRRYADAASSKAIGLPISGGGGLVFPLVFPLTFGAGSVGGQMVCTNMGTIATWPTWSILGPTTGPIITNADTGELLSFDPTLVIPAGQTMVIDTNAKTVLLTGVNYRDRLFVSNWFRFNPGITNVRFASISGADPSALLTAAWRDAWT